MDVGHISDPQTFADEPPVRKQLTPKRYMQKGLRKTRTGCSTCKIRHVKCDEVRPSCKRCTTTGRRCDGYEIAPRKKRSQCRSQTRPSPPIELIEHLLVCEEGAHAERSALEFFQQRTIWDLSSYFHSDLCSGLTLQIGHTEPAIRHAAIAIASLHRQRRAVPSVFTTKSYQSVAGKHMDLMQLQPMDYDHRFALLHYNYAVSLTATRVGLGDQSSTELALIACVLFICFEFLRGNAHLALQHYKSGMAIVLDTLHKNRLSRPILERIKYQLLPCFCRFEPLSMLLGPELSWEYPKTPLHTISDSFVSVLDARVSLVHIMDPGLRFIRTLKRRGPIKGLTQRDLAQQADLLSALQSWRDKLNTFCKGDSTLKNLEQVSILDLRYIVFRIWLLSATQTTESYFDCHMADFQAALQLAHSIRAHSNHPISPTVLIPSTSSSSSAFFTNMELILPMYFIAVKCRHSTFRWRASFVLRSIASDDGLWDSDIIAAVAERVIRLEEDSLPVSPTDGIALNGSRVASDGGMIFPEEDGRVREPHIDSMVMLDLTQYVTILSHEV